MPMLLDIQRKLFSRSPRVKSLDLHPTQPWLIAGLYSGSVHLWNYDTGVLLNTFEVSQVPVRCVRFVSRNNWFLAGSDDFHLRCFNYNTHEKVASFEAHPDYIRSIAVHPTASIVLTGSDDMTIRMWDWEKGWKLIQTFEGHTHFIMHLTINPKDSNTFASACLDRTVKVWTLNPSGSGSSYSRVEPNYTLDAHEKGVNYVEFYQGADRPYMVTTGDDRTVKIWDYLTKSCVQTLHGHTSNVSFAVFHPHLPLIISGAEDGSVRLWHSGTYRLERTLEYGLERAWCLAYRRNPNTSGGASLTSGAGINDIALGYDEGTVVIKLGKEDPTVSMDGAGKIVWTRNSEVRTANVGQGSSGEDAPSIPDGNRLPLSIRELGTTDLYAQSLTHSPNGRFVTVLGDGEYVIYTALAWRNKAFGSALSFAWSSDSNTYAVRESGGRVRVYRSFKERVGLVNPGWKVEDTKSGTLLGLVGNGFVCFHDWETGALVRRIDVDVKNVYWSQSGNLVAIQTPDSFYVLRFDRDAYNAYLESGEPIEDDGVEDAFELITEVAETVKTAKWTGECFIYTNSLNRLQYLVGEQTSTVAHTDTELYLLGYMPQHGKVYLADKDMSVFSYTLSLAVVDYQTAILRGDLEEASSILSGVPSEQRNKIARFLEAQNLQQLALDVSTDSDHRFDLAISLDNFETALDIARSGPQAGSESRWRTIGDKALERWNISLAQECFEKAGDLSALLLIGTSTGDRGLLDRLVELSIEKGSTNIAFAAILSLGEKERGIDLLVKIGRIPEAALFARTYSPKRVPEIVKLWKSELGSTKRSKQNAIADSIADPEFNPEVFEEGWQEALKKGNMMDGDEKKSKSLIGGETTKETKVVVAAETEKMSGAKSNGVQAPPGEDLLA